MPRRGRGGRAKAAAAFDIVYADSLTPVSDEGFRTSGDATRPSRVDVFRASIDRVEQLPCDVVLAPHPVLNNFAARVAQLEAGAAEHPFIQPNACRAYAAAARKKLEQRIVDERG